MLVLTYNNIYTHTNRRIVMHAHTIADSRILARDSHLTGYHPPAAHSNRSAIVVVVVAVVVVHLYTTNLVRA